MIWSDVARPKIAVHITVRVCKNKTPMKTHECSVLKKMADKRDV